MGAPRSLLNAARRGGCTRALSIGVALCALVCLMPARALAANTEEST